LPPRATAKTHRRAKACSSRPAWPSASASPARARARAPMMHAVAAGGDDSCTRRDAQQHWITRSSAHACDSPPARGSAAAYACPAHAASAQAAAGRSPSLRAGRGGLCALQ
jgi:hypothetical protein